MIGDGILAIFTAANLAHPCAAALAAATAARAEVAALNVRRTGGGLPVTDMYLGLHVGDVFYGNVASTERLDFTVVGPADEKRAILASWRRTRVQCKQRQTLRIPRGCSRPIPVDEILEALCSLDRAAIEQAVEISWLRRQSGGARSSVSKHDAAIRMGILVTVFCTETSFASSLFGETTSDFNRK